MRSAASPMKSYDLEDQSMVEDKPTGGVDAGAIAIQLNDACHAYEHGKATSATDEMWNEGLAAIHDLAAELDEARKEIKRLKHER